MIRPGASLELEIMKATAGGRMLARHDGQVVLVWGAIPGERVVARVERVTKGVVFADAVDVVSASSDRRAVAGDWRCGGNVLAHVEYARQVQLKAEIIRDAFVRIGRMPLAETPQVLGSPEHGYRMRARLHAEGARLGFYREASHQLCDAVQTRQLSSEANAWIAHAQESLARQNLTGIAAIDLAENAAGDQRACHVELHAGIDPAPYATLADGLTGLSAQRSDASTPVTLDGTPAVTDELRITDDAWGAVLRLRRDVRAFFQANRFLLERFVRHVTARVAPGPVVDLYAGVGLFGLALAAAGADGVVLVEGDHVSGADLQANAEPFRGRVRVERRSVEEYLRRGRAGEATYIIDPPRTGLSRDAIRGVVEHRPTRLVYVSCDVATLARDARALVDAGYELEDLTALDMFPNTAHIECVAVFSASSPR